MILFSSIRWRNFLSTGNDWTTISLNHSPSTLIVGQNGSGKSTLLDALSFGLFSKPHRSINKPQLINSINNKNCEVEVEFSIGKHEFKICRGLKPTKFEIWQNGIMINQDSTSRDYQKYLEQNIIKLNHKSFHQIIVLGSSSFIPFMQLPAHHRREVIEDLLDIQIFSKMNQILKEKDSKIKEDLKDIAYQIDLSKEKISLQKKYISDIELLNEDQIKNKKKEISDVKKQIENLDNDTLQWQKFIDENLSTVNSQLNKHKNGKNQIVKYEAQFQQQMRNVVKDAKFYEGNKECPTCTQIISDELRSKKLDESRSKAKELQEAISQAENKSLELDNMIEKLSAEIDHINKLNGNIRANQQAVKDRKDQIEELQNQISNLADSKGNLSNAKNEYDSLVEELVILNDRKSEINDQKSYNLVASEMLKDSGIKTKVIKQYLPVMNTLINKYLQTLDFFVSFNLDENFDETIKSRYRDAFKYASFSEGEKQRIDLALLFTWRQIAKMKNSVSTNLLVLDETFDSSLDHEGVDNLMKILHTLDPDTNVFVISHKGDLLDGKFRGKITFKKEHNFSQMI